METSNVFILLFFPHCFWTLKWAQINCWKLFGTCIFSSLYCWLRSAWMVQEQPSTSERTATWGRLNRNINVTVLLTFKHQPSCWKLHLHHQVDAKLKIWTFHNQNILNMIMHVSPFLFFFNRCNVFKQIRAITPHCALSLTQNLWMYLHLQTFDFYR